MQESDSGMRGVLFHGLSGPDLHRRPGSSQNTGWKKLSHGSPEQCCKLAKLSSKGHSLGQRNLKWDAEEAGKVVQRVLGSRVLCHTGNHLKPSTHPPFLKGGPASTNMRSTGKHFSQTPRAPFSRQIPTEGKYFIQQCLWRSYWHSSRH